MVTLQYTLSLDDPADLSFLDDVPCMGKKSPVKTGCDSWRPMISEFGVAEDSTEFQVAEDSTEFEFVLESADGVELELVIDPPADDLQALPSSSLPVSEVFNFNCRSFDEYYPSMQIYTFLHVPHRVQWRMPTESYHLTLLLG